MGLSTIAEGIEDAATGERLAAMGCSHAQGYYYARPMTKAQIEQVFQTEPELKAYILDRMPDGDFKTFVLALFSR